MGDVHDHSAHRASQRTALVAVLVVNVVLLIAEVAGGWAFGSLALLADAVHVASDVGGVGIALVAIALAAKPSSSRHSYGLQRAEVLGALFNALFIMVVGGWVMIEAIGRLSGAPSVDGGG